MENRKIYSVSSVNSYIKALFMDDHSLNNIYVSGEISNCKYHSSGHIYFTLKDKGSQISCVMFSGNRKGLTFRMNEGMAVIVFGSISVYERDGKYQLYARAIRQQGVGDLYEAFDKLKKKLQEEGLFAADHKLNIPAYPRKLGVVTAKTGAAVQDIINVSLRRNPYLQIIFCSAKVQGEGAAESIVRAVRAVEAAGVDVMIVGRGGGSIEDLWAFNEEIVARAVYECSVPVISAVGHETDTTIIDFVADLRAPTPSAAAELAVPDVMGLIRMIDDYKRRLTDDMTNIITVRRKSLDQYKAYLRLLSPARQIADKRQRLIQSEEKLALLISTRLSEKKNSLSVYAGRLSALSPLKQLERGYAYITDKDGHGISRIDDVMLGDTVNIAVSDGDIKAQAIYKQVRKYG